MDRGKFDSRALHAFTPLSAFTSVLTGAALEPERARVMAESGVRVNVAG